MSDEPRTLVLAQYRRFRAAGLTPANAIDAVRNHHANAIALAVACKTAPHDDAVMCWLAATAYANTMHRRGLYWFRPRSFRPAPAPAADRPRRSIIHR